MAVTKFSGLPEDYPEWSKRAETFASMRGCLISLLAGTGIAVGDTAKDTHLFIYQVLSAVHVKEARTAWICLTKSMSNTDLLDRLVVVQSPRGAWKKLRRWLLPTSIAAQVKWSGAFSAIQMEKGGESMKFFSRWS